MPGQLDQAAKIRKNMMPEFQYLNGAFSLLPEAYFDQSWGGLLFGTSRASARAAQKWEMRIRPDLANRNEGLGRAQGCPLRESERGLDQQ